MAEKRIYFEVTADTARKNYIERPTLVQNADYGLILHLRHNGGVMDLSDVRDVVLATQPANRRTPSVATLGRVSGESEVTIDFGRSEVENVGVVNAQVKLLGEDGGTISTTTFEFEVQRDINEGSEPTERDLTLFEIVLGEGPGVIDDARAATQEALDARDRLTEDVRQSIQTLEQDKTAALEELDTRTTAAETQMDERTTAAIEQMADVREANRTDYLNAVATVQERDTAYPNPRHGDTVRVTGEGRTYRYKDGEGWTVVDEDNPTALNEALSKLDDAGAAQTVLSEGTHIVKSPTDSPVGVEIRGTTLVSLGNSNLEKGKYYALTDEKYKVITDGKTVSGVGKFQKGETHKTTADFKGRQEGSSADNPNAAYRVSRQTLISPAYYTTEFGTAQYASVSERDGNLFQYGAAAVDLYFSGHAFSFNIIEQVERKLGVIPGSTISDKIAWLKSNVSHIVARWYGYGTGPGGNRVTLSRWNAATNSYPGGTRHESGSVGVLTYTVSNMDEALDNGGFSHFIAHAEPSDGVTASTIYTDYAELEINLKPTAQLNTRPTIVRVENFEGKVRGETTANPHVAHCPSSPSTLAKPNEIHNEFSQASYDLLKTQDSQSAALSTTVAGRLSQMIFSYNVVEAVERNVGKIPSSTLSGKISWAKANLLSIEGTIHGLGASPAGNKLTFTRWNTKTNDWSTIPVYNMTSTLAKLSRFVPVEDIDELGYVHFSAHADASNGTKASSLQVDFTELEIQLKPTADFMQPRIPLYEVSKEEYDRIGVSQTDAETKRRYPIVQGVQHLVNPYVVNPGENLLPPFTEVIRDPTDIERYSSITPHEATPSIRGAVSAGTSIPVAPNTQYRLSSHIDIEIPGFNQARFRADEYDSKGNFLTYGSSSWVGQSGESVQVFTTSSNTRYIKIVTQTASTSVGRITFRNPMLTLGTKSKPFTPYNPSTLSAPVTLSAVGDRRDVLYQQDGRWYVRNSVKETELTGDFDWKAGRLGTGILRTVVNDFYPFRTGGTMSQLVVTDYKGVKYSSDYTNTESRYAWINDAGGLYLTLDENETGIFPGAPINTGDGRRFFNGWRYTDGTTWESVTGNGQTATAEEALTAMPTDYTPYRLTYVLATPEVTDVTDTVEGDLIVSELAQITVGSEGQVNVQDAILTIQQSLRSAFDALNVKVSDNTRDSLMLKRQMLEVLVRLDALEGNLDELEGRTDALEGAVDDLTPEPPVEGGETV
ncbi:hypothetical protein [Bhargavaea ginsengi]|uniref:hypothetical protein n=1 Tax=Bhargavaea ginsengi TaxID=426757 RepID=UPI003C78AD3C